jgi:hypothetical protein
VARVEISKDGVIVVIPGKSPDKASPPSAPPNEWDEVL